MELKDKILKKTGLKIKEKGGNEESMRTADGHSRAVNVAV